ncbi:MAG: OadG family protein [Gammaproteobacteria bacterium]|nr:OadG family protein [Gammaproteobacteria bacterium]
MTDFAFIITGFGIVIAVLSFLWLACAFVGWLHRDARPHPPAETETPGPAQSPIPGAHLAAISAAIAVLLPGRHRIVRVYAPGHRTMAWIEEGRFEMSTSHRVRWGWTAPGPSSPSQPTAKQEHS